MIKFLLKRWVDIKELVLYVLPWIVSQIVLDIDTVEKKDGFYLRVRVEIQALDRVLVDRYIKISGQTSKDMNAKEILTLDEPLDVRTNILGGDPFE